MALLILLVLIAADGLAAWKGTGRNRGIVEEQHVEPRHPFDQ